MEVLMHVIVIIIFLACFVFVIVKLDDKMEKRKKSPQEQLLMKELKSLKKSLNEDDLVHLYEKSKLYEKVPNYDILTEIISQLIKIKAFPKGVMNWLDSPTAYTQDDLFDVMEEFVAMRQSRLKDEIAVRAYTDGFITVEQALAYTDKTRYPKTVALLLSDPEDYDGIRKIVKKEQKAKKLS